jgi:glycosyltransferase involved in cell wall biosynthesis
MKNLEKLAICAVVKNEDIYISEWIAFHLLQGISDILIFDNQSTDGTRDTLAQISKYAPVQVVEWPGNHYHAMQLDAYREGARRLSGVADWVAFIDVDEFLFSSRNLPLSMELAELDAEVGALAIGHRIFGSSGHTTYEPELVTSRFVRCARPDHPQSQWFKTIARPHLIETVDTAHSVKLTAGAYMLADLTPLRHDYPGWHSGHADRVGHGTISLFHYMVKSLEEYRWKQIRFGEKNMEYRYTDQFFHEHDCIGNEMENDELRRFAEPIRAMASQWA